MSLDKTTVAMAVGTGTTIGVSSAKSAQSAQSLLNSSIAQIVSGEFTWYGSDIATVAGILLSLAGVIVTIWRIRSAKRIVDAI